MVRVRTRDEMLQSYIIQNHAHCYRRLTGVTRTPTSQVGYKRSPAVEITKKTLLSDVVMLTTYDVRRQMLWRLYDRSDSYHGNITNANVLLINCRT